jgi:hypothetical protein
MHHHTLRPHRSTRRTATQQRSEMTPIFKNDEIKFEDIGEYMQNYHNENDIPFIKVKT